MKSNYKIIAIITLLLLTLSITISVVNYMVAKNETQANLKTQSLPLSVDNIYTVIQKQLIEPYLVSSMMAHDTFLKHWLLHDESDSLKIANFLSSIKNKYGLLTSFLVSNETGRYYTHNGFLEKINEKNPTNEWYFEFLKISQNHEINLDYNSNFTDNLIMFINFKIYDEKQTFLGVTGVGIEVSYIDEMLDMFKQRYNLDVMFVTPDGEVVLSKKSKYVKRHLNEMEVLKNYKDLITTQDANMFEYEKNSDDYIMQTKYIPELGVYLIVEACIDDFAYKARNVFYFNLAISLFFTLIFALIIILILRSYHKRLEKLADYDALTNIPNRRKFNEEFERFLSLHQRDARPISLLFLDIDNFKSINDKQGHQAGDKILVKTAEILRKNIRKTDLLARWGGEEFIIAFIDTNINDALNISQKIREAIEKDSKLKEISSYGVTASFGLTACNDTDSVDSIISRADNAMYEAKENGKNRVVLSR
ncbi:MAG: sensor domain-containing diguanylate cyclase [Sulfurimonas sp.]|uniref:sensor domain-containing diguanylate cyclase n=1 Tax=Sulfurimonas sp. TaxID=2022749 RepID=UPI0025DD3A6D|nr:sensor domain-containing diguanylate cyclase [Sulfurimonas sp.]MCK9492259.1 sensor domain-containing diguanylate cyclase [Sulfurimonas sp.]